jgi:hypothetical protein
MTGAGSHRRRLQAPTGGRRRLEALRARAELLAGIRAFFAPPGCWRWRPPSAPPPPPPIRPRQPGDPLAGTRRPQPLYLHTSPEFPMKRLLAAGSGRSIRSARYSATANAGGGTSRVHPAGVVPPGFDHHRLMDEVAALVRSLFAAPCRSAPVLWRAVPAPSGAGCPSGRPGGTARLRHPPGHPRRGGAGPAAAGRLARPAAHPLHRARAGSRRLCFVSRLPRQPGLPGAHPAGRAAAGGAVRTLHGGDRTGQRLPTAC